MDKKFIEKEFNKMEVPEVDVTENVLNSIHGKRPNRRKRFMPKAMVAIALTLIMITGVVFAAGKLINVVEEVPAADEIARYKLDFEFVGVELGDKVSKDLLSYATNPYATEEVTSKHFKKVESYQELEEYLGINIFRSPILDNDFKSVQLVGGQILESNITISSSAVDDKLVSVNFSSYYRFPKTDGSIGFSAQLLTPFGKETFPEYKIQTGHYDFDDNRKREVLTETYTSKKSGITAEIVHISETNRYAAYFESDSIIYTLESSHAGQGLDPRELIIEVIDSLEK